MPEKRTLKRALQDKREGKAAGEGGGAQAHGQRALGGGEEGGTHQDAAGVRKRRGRQLAPVHGTMERGGSTTAPRRTLSHSWSARPGQWVRYVSGLDQART
jgi:hypothetical protein